MKNLHIKIIFLFIGLLSINLYSANQFERALSKDISNGRLDHFTPIEAAFILSGASTQDTLDYYIAWYNTLFKKIEAFNFDPFKPIESAQQVFAFLHGNWLKTYQLEATTLIDVVQHKTFNCVSATILYNIICNDMGWATEAFETPTHVYTYFTNLNEYIMVENTTPMGFNILSNLRLYSQHLAHFYPEQRVYQIGLDQLHAYENSNGREINNTELLGLLAYNQAYFFQKKKNYKKAYEYILLAQQFNEDSRSNQNLERGLYNNWGHELFQKKKYMKAFTVLADGWYRYPDDPDLANNTKVAFVQSLKSSWIKKDWQISSQLFNEIQDFELNDNQLLVYINSMIFQWETFWKQTGNTEQVNEIQTMKSYFRGLIKDN